MIPKDGLLFHYDAAHEPYEKGDKVYVMTDRSDEGTQTIVSREGRQRYQLEKSLKHMAEERRRAMRRAFLLRLWYAIGIIIGLFIFALILWLL